MTDATIIYRGQPAKRIPFTRWCPKCNRRLVATSDIFAEVGLIIVTCSSCSQEPYAVDAHQWRIPDSKRRYRVGFPSGPAPDDPGFATEEEAVHWIEKEQSYRARDQIHAVWHDNEMIAIICDGQTFTP